MSPTEHAFHKQEKQIDRYGDIQVFWLPDLNGGGRTFGQQVVELVRDRFEPAQHAFEWCAGPGFIGFSLLAGDLCRNLTLADINPAAVEMARRTVGHNDLGGRVRVHLSDCLDEIPGDERWDLVVGNPPHCPGERAVPEIGKPEIIYLDPGWKVHRKFYRSLRGRLRPGANVLIQENSDYSSPDDFREMVDEGGLAWVDVIEGARGFYCVWTRNPG